MKITSNIPQLALEKGWNAPTLANRASIDPATAWRLLKGNTNMTTKVLGKLCVAFECKPNDLIEVSR